MPTRDRPGGDIDVRSHPALTDERTGLANRLHFDLVYHYIFEAGDRGVLFTVMLVSTGFDRDEREVDVRELGRTVARTTRNADLVSYMGRGRYVVLMLGTNLQGGRVAADRVELALRGSAPSPVCIGLASYSDEFADSAQLLKAADAALRAAEAAGGGVELA